MTLREILHELQSQVTEDFTEEQLLDLDIKILLSDSTGRYRCCNVGVNSVGIECETRYSSLQHRQVPLKKDAAKTILLQTTMLS